MESQYITSIIMVLILILLISYRIGYSNGRAKADRVLGINRDEALRKIKSRAHKSEIQ